MKLIVCAHVLTQHSVTGSSARRIWRNGGTGSPRRMKPVPRFPQRTRTAGVPQFQPPDTCVALFEMWLKPNPSILTWLRLLRVVTWQIDILSRSRPFLQYRLQFAALKASFFKSREFCGNPLGDADFSNPVPQIIIGHVSKEDLITVISYGGRMV